jgi:Tfp pilus assembly protein PilO
MSARSFSHWSPLQTLLVWVLVACVAAVVWYAVFWVGARERVLAARNELGFAEARLASAREDLGRRQGLSAELARGEAALAGRIAAVPGADGRGADPLALIPGLAEAAGLTIDRWRPLPDEPAGPLVRAPVEVAARGDWRALQTFLERAAALPEVVVVDGLSLQPRGDAELELRFVVAVVRLAEGQP